jgi:adenylate cyclase
MAARLEGIADPGGILVSSKVHGEVEGKLDLSFEDRGECQLKNISKSVRAYAIRRKARTESSPPVLPGRRAESLSLPDKPSIAVLPFQNMSGDPEQEYFADGIVEDIITALSRFKSLFVIARNSSFAYKGKPVDIKQVGRALGVRYVLEGSVRKITGRVRITGQLIEASTGVGAMRMTDQRVSCYLTSSRRWPIIIQPHPGMAAGTRCPTTHPHHRRTHFRNST